MLSKPFLALVTIVILLAVGCTTRRSYFRSSTDSDSVEIKDQDLENINSNSNEIAIFDSDLNADSVGDTGKLPSKKREEGNRQANDSSKITTMVDAVGNKTESRDFINHSRVRKVIIRTGVDGKFKIFVYGNNGEVKRITNKSPDEFRKASGDEIANTAKIYESREQRDRRRADEARIRAENIKSAEAEAVEARQNATTQSEKGSAPRIADKQNFDNQKFDQNQDN